MTGCVLPVALGGPHIGPELTVQSRREHSNYFTGVTCPGARAVPSDDSHPAAVALPPDLRATLCRN